MTKGQDYFESSRDCGGPIVLLPRSLIREVIMEEAPDTGEESGGQEIYGLFCEGNEWLQVVPIEDALALRMGEGSMPVFWLPRPDGALAVQWQGADSEVQLLDFALNHPGIEDWDEEVNFDAGDGQFFLADCTGAILGSNDGRLCEVNLQPGHYRVTAKWLEDESVMAILFKFTRIS